MSAGRITKFKCKINIFDNITWRVTHIQIGWNRDKPKVATQRVHSVGKIHRRNSIIFVDVVEMSESDVRHYVDIASTTKVVDVEMVSKHDVVTMLKSVGHQIATSL